MSFYSTPSLQVLSDLSKLSHGRMLGSTVAGESCIGGCVIILRILAVLTTAKSIERSDQAYTSA